MKKINLFVIALAAALAVVSCSEKVPAIEKELDYYVSSDKVLAGTPVSFTDLSIGAKSRVWTFQDGTPSTSTDAEVNVTFASYGDKACSIEVTFKDNTVEKKEFTVHVDEVLDATVVASGLTAKGCAKLNKEVTFSLDLKGAADSYQWSFPGGNPSTSTEAAPKVTWAEQNNSVEVSVVITRSADNTSITRTLEIVAGDYPCLRPIKSRNYDPYSFEMESFGGWTAWNKEVLDGYENNDIGTAVGGKLLSVVAGDGACGTSHCLKIDMSVFPSKAIDLTDASFDWDYYCDLFSRANWMCNAHLEKDHKYRLEFWAKRTFDLDPYAAYGFTNASAGRAFTAVVLRNNLNDWGDVNSTLGVSTTDNWNDFWPGITFEVQADAIVGGVSHWGDETIPTFAPSDGWVKNSWEFVSDGNYLNVYPYLRIVPIWNLTGLYVDEFQIYEIE